jgi:hypothetical protein
MAVNLRHSIKNNDIGAGHIAMSDAQLVRALAPTEGGIRSGFVKDDANLYKIKGCVGNKFQCTYSLKCHVRHVVLAPGQFSSEKRLLNSAPPNSAEA